MDGTLVAATDVNPDPVGRASPIVVRIYQLRSTVKFGNASFFALYDDAATTLGADMIGFEEFTLRPGQTVNQQATFDPAAKHIGIVAAFRDINSAQWRSELDIPKEPDRLKVTLEKLSVSAAFED